MATKLPRSLNITLSVLSVIGIILWTIGAFFGLYFFSCGSLGLAVPIAFGSGLLLALFIWLTRRYTGYVAEAYRRKEAARFRMIYLAAYIAVVLGSGWLVMHAVAVSTTIKTEYRDSAVKDLAGLYNLVDNRAPAGSYAEYVNEQLQRYREGNYQKETSTLEFECSQLEQKLTKSSGYAALQREITDYWQYADKTVRDWDMWYLPSTAFTFHSRMNEWRSALEKCSSAGNSGIYTTLHTPYNVKFIPESDIYYSLTSLGGVDFGVWSILVVLLLQLLILSPWLAMHGGKTETPTGIDTNSVHRNGPTVWESGSTWTPID